QQIRLNTYAAVLDKQYEAIEQGETEAILWYIELEEQLSRELAAIQKAVIPLEKKCCFGVKAQGNDALHRSKAEVQLRLQRNRDALAQQMACLRSQLQTLKLSPLLRTSVYAREGISSRLDIRL
ncbi:MAG: hypothetical protein LBD74_02850, partial [Spirochaetaceae bacterium]|nr:hypothetical protein [Spirochaetaceae bacterium]